MAKADVRGKVAGRRSDVKASAKRSAPAAGQERPPRAERPAVVTVEEASPRTRKEAALKRALTATLGGAGSGKVTAAAAAEPDAYGKGSATDRLQFGYAPAITEEAVAYHSRISVRRWLEERRTNGRIAFVKHQKLPRPNCEPTLSLLKLKNHWSRVSQFQSGFRGEHITSQDADALLEMLAAKQRVGPAEGGSV